jgi:hypothetical protein
VASPSLRTIVVVETLVAKDDKMAKIKEECIVCEHEFDIECEAGVRGECPNCTNRYTVDWAYDEPDLLIVHWHTGLNINDFPELADE